MVLHIYSTCQSRNDIRNTSNSTSQPDIGLHCPNASMLQCLRLADPGSADPLIFSFRLWLVAARNGNPAVHPQNPSRY